MNGGTKVLISGCVVRAAVVKAIGGAVTHIYVETGIVMVAPIAVDTLAPTVWADTCVDCACEYDCDNCEDTEVPLLVGRAISFKALSLLKCIHKQISFQKMVYQKQI